MHPTPSRARRARADRRIPRLWAALAAAATLAACGGGGGDGGGNPPPPQPPVVTISANPTSVTSGGTTTLSWSATNNPTSCSASGGWSGAKPASGNEVSTALTATTTFTLACTNAGGTGTQSVTVNVTAPGTPTATLAANPTSVAPGGTTQLTWSSTNATACTASGTGWNAPGARPASGTETSLALNASTTFNLSCTGPGGTANATPVTVSVATGLTINGTVQFERPRRVGNGFDYTQIDTLPARGVTIEILQGASGATVLATAVTSAAGGFSVTLPTAQTFRVRARAELARSGTAPTFQFRVLNNTNGNALYVLDSAAQSPPAGTFNITLTAPLGRGGTNGTSITGTRASAPFAILDTMYQKKERVVAAAPTIAMPAVNIYWATANTSTTPATCNGDPNPVTGQIGTTFFLSGAIPASGSCPAVPAGIYVLGDAAVDSDEFDASVIAHESGHYYEDSFARGDSMGGPHSLSDVFDLRLAWSEGFSNAYSGMVLNDSRYRDTFVGGTGVFSFDMEANFGGNGWFSEATVGELMWDAFDAVNDGSDAVSLGFAPIHQMMTSGMRNTTALGSIFVAFSNLIAGNAAEATALRNLRNGENVNGTDEWGAGETNAAGLTPTSLALPPYATLPLATPTQVTSSNRFPDGDAVFASYNRLGARRYFRVTLAANGNYRVTAQGPAAPQSDPDFNLYRRGVLVCSGAADSYLTNGLEDTTCNGLTAGEYVLEVFECSNAGQICRGPSSTARGDTAITVTVSQAP